MIIDVAFYLAALAAVGIILWFAVRAVDARRPPDIADAPGHLPDGHDVLLYGADDAYHRCRGRAKDFYGVNWPLQAFHYAPEGGDASSLLALKGKTVKVAPEPESDVPRLAVGVLVDVLFTPPGEVWLVVLRSTAKTHYSDVEDEGNDQ